MIIESFLTIVGAVAVVKYAFKKGRDKERANTKPTYIIVKEDEEEESEQ